MSILGKISNRGCWLLGVAETGTTVTMTSLTTDDGMSDVITGVSAVTSSTTRHTTDDIASRLSTERDMTSSNMTSRERHTHVWGMMTSHVNDVSGASTDSVASKLNLASTTYSAVAPLTSPAESASSNSAMTSNVVIATVTESASSGRWQAQQLTYQTASSVHSDLYDIDTTQPQSVTDATATPEPSASRSNDTMTSHTSDVVMTTTGDNALATSLQVEALTNQQSTASTASTSTVYDSETNLPTAAGNRNTSSNLELPTFPSSEVVTSYVVMTAANDSELLTRSSLTSFATQYRPTATRQSTNAVDSNTTLSNDTMTSHITLTTITDNLPTNSPKVELSTHEQLTESTASAFGSQTTQQFVRDVNSSIASVNTTFSAASPSNDITTSHVAMTTANYSELLTASLPTSFATQYRQTANTRVSTYTVDSEVTLSNDTMTSHVALTTITDNLRTGSTEVELSTDEQSVKSTANIIVGQSTQPPTGDINSSVTGSSTTELAASPSNGITTSHVAMTTANDSQVLTAQYRQTAVSRHSTDAVSSDVASSSDMTSQVALATTTESVHTDSPQVKLSTYELFVKSTASVFGSRTTQQPNGEINRTLASTGYEVMTSDVVMATTSVSTPGGRAQVGLSTSQHSDIRAGSSEWTTAPAASAGQFSTDRSNASLLSTSDDKLSTDVAMTTTNQNVSANSPLVELFTSSPFNETTIAVRSSSQSAVATSEVATPTTSASVRSSSPSIDMETSEHFNESTSGVYVNETALPKTFNSTSRSSITVETVTFHSNDTMTPGVSMTTMTKSAPTKSPQSERMTAQYYDEFTTSRSVNETIQQSSSDVTRPLQLSTSPSNDVNMTTSTKSSVSSSSSSRVSLVSITPGVNITTPVLTSRDTEMTSVGASSAAVHVDTMSTSSITGSTWPSIRSSLVTSVNVSSLQSSRPSSSTTSPTGITNASTNTPTTTSTTSIITSSSSSSSEPTAAVTDYHQLSFTSSAEMSSHDVMTSSQPAHSTLSAVAKTTPTMLSVTNVTRLRSSSSSSSASSTAAATTSRVRQSTLMTSHLAIMTSSPVVITTSRKGATSSVSATSTVLYMTSEPILPGRWRFHYLHFLFAN